MNRSNRFRLKLHNRPYSPFSSAGRFCKAVQVKSGLPAQWCCTSQRPGANNLMSVLRVEKPPPCWRRKSLSWWVKILNKLQCHVPWTTLSNLKTVQSVTRWIFAIGTRVISPVWERKSRSFCSRNSDRTWSDPLCYCQIVLLHKRNTKTRCPAGRGVLSIS